MQGGMPKQYLAIDGESILAYTLDVFQRSPDIDDIILVVPGEDVQMVWQGIIEPYKFSKVSHVAAGGRQRQDSVRNGLAMIGGHIDIVVIHDAVRPFVSKELIHLAVRSAVKYDAVTVGMPVKDTVKKVDQDGWIVETLERQVLWMTQTPQAFKRSVIQEAYRKAEEDGFYGTDDASLVERAGFRVKMITGSYANVKITTPEDLLFAEFLSRNNEGAGR